MNRLIACNHCQTTLTLGQDLKPNTRVRCPKCGNAVEVVNVAAQNKKMLTPMAEPVPAARPVLPRTPPAKPGFLSFAVPACAIVIGLLSLALPIVLGEYVAGMIVAGVASLVSIVGLLLLASGKSKGTPLHLSGAAIGAAAFLLAVNAVMLKSSIETNAALREKNDQAVAQAKTHQDEAAKKLAVAEDTLKKAAAEPLKAEKLYELAKRAQEKSEANEKSAADLLAQAKETEVKNQKNRVKNFNDRIAVEEAQKNLAKMQAAFADEKKDIEDKSNALAEQKAELFKLKNGIAADKKAAEDEKKEAKDLLKKVEGALKGAALKLKDKNVQVRLKAAAGLGELAKMPMVKELVAEKLVEAMFDPVPDVQKAAGVALEKIDPDIHPHVLTIAIGQDKYGAINKLAQMGPKAKNALPAILYVYNAGNKAPNAAQMRYVISLSISNVVKIAPDDQRVIAIVFDLVVRSGNTHDVRHTAIVAMKHLDVDGKEKAKTLLTALKDGHYPTLVIHSIGELGLDAKEAIPVLTKLKFSPDDQIRQAATKALTVIEAAKLQPE